MLRVLIDTDVLMDQINVESSVESTEGFLFNKEIFKENCLSAWISAGSISSIASFFNDTGIDRISLDRLFGQYSVIPFQLSAITKSLQNNNHDIESQFQIEAAKAFNIDLIVTNSVERYEHAPMPAIKPEDFINKCNTDNIKKVKQVPFLDLKAQQSLIYNELEERIVDIIVNTGFILGKYVDEFEQGFADLQEAKYCIGVSSGTDALHIALQALEIGHGDFVIVPVNTFIATAEAVSHCGAVPIFIDCDDFYNIDTNKVKELILSLNDEQKLKIKAIIPVHLYGQPVDMHKLMNLAGEYQLAVVEDACQAHMATWHGKRVGSFGAFGAFSFYPGKNLGAYGESGALITNNAVLYKKAKMLRQHGEIERYHHEVIGHNYRMEAFQGAVLSVKLKYIEMWTKQRQQNAALYNELLSDVEEIDLPQEQDGAESVHHLYVIQTDDQNELQKFLNDRGVSTGFHYPIPLHLQEAYKHLGYKKGDFPVAERAAGRILSLPMYPELTEDQIHYVCCTIKDYYSLSHK
jgi:dTDP-4-amino-4,6-dideoxygalactose transaminase